MAVTNWHGLLVEIAEQPRKNRYGAVLSRPPIVRLFGAVLLAAGVAGVVFAARRAFS